MRNNTIFPAVLGAVMLIGGGALAEGRQNSGGSAGVMSQERAAQRVEAASVDREVQQLLDQARQAVSAGNWTRAFEFTARAETSWLNRQAMQGGRPGSVPGNAFNQVRQAIETRDRGEARRALQSAMSELGGGDTATGTGTSRMPQQGGGAAGHSMPQEMHQDDTTGTR
jgi:hypothetical protein